jgi:3-oxoacyl-[acyl-carrier-protein] synthase-3
VTLWLPPLRDTADAAVAAGRLSPQDAARIDYLALAVSETLAAPEMAVRAAGSALTTAGWDPATIDLAVHAWTYYQGHDFWSPPHFVAYGAGARRAVPVGVAQMCNGGVAAVEIAAARLLADPSVARAMVTTADRFTGPGFDRWRSDAGAAYGDGATALLLASPLEAAGHDAPLRLLAVVTTAAPELEVMHRGSDPFAPAPRSLVQQVDTRRTIAPFLGLGGGPLLDDTAVKAVHTVLTTGLAEANLDGDDPRLRFIALPRLGRAVLDTAYHAVLAGHTRATILDLGRETGHLGAGDALANLATIHAAGMLADGEFAILLSVGAGFTWSAMLVQATRRPAAPPPRRAASSAPPAERNVASR